MKKVLLVTTCLLASMGTALAAPLPTQRCTQKIFWLWGANCYQPGAQEDANRTGAANRSTLKGDRLHGSASPAAPKGDRISSPSTPSAPAAPDTPAASPQTADGGGGGVINPTGGGGSGGNPPPGGGGNPPPGGGGNPPDDGGGNPPPAPGLGNPGNNKAVGRAGENPGGHDFGPTGARGRLH